MKRKKSDFSDKIENKNYSSIFNEDNSNTNIYSIKESQIIRDFPLSELKEKNFGYKIIMKSVFK